MKITCHICEGKGTVTVRYPESSDAFMRSVLGSRKPVAFKVEQVECTLCEGKGHYVREEKPRAQN